MDLIRITIEQDLAELEDDLRRSFGDLYQVVNPYSGCNERGWQPQMDIYENEEEIIILAEMAGVDKEDISVEVRGRLLTIIGLRSKRKTAKDCRYHLAEIPYGYFKRIFSLPASVDTDNIQATYDAGMLEVRLAKSISPKKIHRISVTT